MATERRFSMAIVKKLLRSAFSEKWISIFVVYIALFLDYMLMTTIVPVLPAYLDEIRNADSCGSNNLSISCDKNTKNGSSPVATFSGLSMAQNFSSDGGSNGRGQYNDDSLRIGILLGSKAFVQIATNPIVGPLTNRIGYTIPLFAGFLILFASTLSFAFASSYAALLLARATQGVGSACCNTAGFGLLAATFTDPSERGTALSIALGGLALGVLVGYPYGGLMYGWAGKAAPFLLLAGLALATATLQFIFLRPKFTKQSKVGTSILKLLVDPYIVLSAGSVVICYCGIATLEASLPLWMKETMKSSPSTAGISFVPVSIFYLLSIHTVGPFGQKIGRWLLLCLGLAICGLCLTMIPLAKNVFELLAPLIFYGLGIGIFDAVIFAEMGNLVDLRHVGVYGNIYAISDTSACIAFAIGPLATGALIKATSFTIMICIIGGLSLAYAPFLLFLKNPKSRNI